MTATDTDQPGAAERSKLTPAQIAFRAVATLIVASSFGVWVYIYSGYADREAPDLLADRDLAAAAEGICASALVDVEAMPDALEAVDGEDRGEQIRLTTARFETMVAELDALPTQGGRDERMFTAWLADWRVLLGDRLTYATAIATDQNAQFLITDTGVSERLDRRITRFADTNVMSSCGAPSDV